MARPDHVLSTIVAELSTLGDDDYVALANRGLVRRARKDLAGGVPVRLAGAAAEGLSLEIGNEEVTLTRAGPSAATCTCPDSGVCRHILIACFAIPSLAGPTAGGTGRETAGDPRGGAERELLELTAGHLRRWAGAGALRRANQLAIDYRNAVAIDRGPPLVVTAEAVGIEVRFVDGAGLDGAISRAGSKARRAHVAAAVLAYRHHLGQPIELPASEAPTGRGLTGTPRTHPEIVAAARRLVEETVEAGLSHLSSDRLSRFESLAIAARGVRLYRLAAELSAVADDVALLLRRSARSDSDRLLDRLARLNALGAALGPTRSPLPTALVGEARSHYDDVPQLDLAGLGAYAWRTPSGYHGLTLLFLDRAGDEVLSWSDVRPLTKSKGFQPLARYRGLSPWRHGRDLATLCRCHIRLRNARRNRQGRLGASEKTVARVGGLVSPTELQPKGRRFDDWLDLREYAAGQSAVGLRPAPALGGVVLVEPSRWGEQSFDEVDQAFYWSIQDRRGLSLPLRLDFSSLNEPAIDYLEHLSPPRRTLVVAIVIRRPSLHLYPISLLTEADGRGELFNLTLDGNVKGELWWRRLVRQSHQGSSVPDLDSARVAAPESASPSPLAAHLTELNDFLLARAETGTQRLSEAQSEALEVALGRLERSGLTQLRQAAGQIHHTEGRALSQAILAARYVALLHLQAEAAVAGLDA